MFFGGWKIRRSIFTAGGWKGKEAEGDQGGEGGGIRTTCGRSGMDRQPYFTSEGAAGFTTVGFCVWPEEKQEKKELRCEVPLFIKSFFFVSV